MAAAVQITARGSRATIEAAANALDADPALEWAAWSRIEEDEDQDIWRLDGYPASADEARAMRAIVAGFADLKVATITLADADWIALSLSGLPPVRAGRFFIYGAHDKGRVPVNAVALRIEAGAAFGTGHHGTTVGCLAAFDWLLKSRGFHRVLDVGTGTGVLAIAAARTGSRRAVGTDIDPISVEVSRSNARLNRARCDFVTADGLAAAQARRHAPYDLVFANILAGPLISLAQDIRSALKPGGVAILSGLLRTQARSVRAAYVARGFRVRRRLDRDAWTTLVVERRGQGSDRRAPRREGRSPGARFPAQCRWPRSTDCELRSGSTDWPINSSLLTLGRSAGGQSGSCLRAPGSRTLAATADRLVAGLNLDHSRPPSDGCSDEGGGQ